jgi:flagellar hook-associated protein 3 FlgL
MSNIRISERNYALSSLGGLQSSASRLTALQSQLASGRQITKPSDNPSGTVAAMELRSQLRRVDQYAASASDGLGWLTQVDTTLTSSISQLQQVRTFILQAANTGANNSASLATLANQVQAGRDSILSLANAQYLGRPVFGGTTTGTTAFTVSGSGASAVVSYAGDTGSVSRTIDDNTTVQINQLGTSVFGANGANLFDLMNTISADITSNPAALSGDLDKLDAAMNTISNQQALAGSTYARIQSLQASSGTTSTQLKSQLSDLQDIDVADLAIQVSAANVAYQAALQTTANIRQTSLLDFLR